MYDKWCPENDGAWQDMRAEIARLRKEKEIQPYLDEIEELKSQIASLERICTTEFEELTDEDYSEWVDVAGRNKIKELQEQVHYCPDCGEYCKQCTCWEDHLEAIASELECVECEEWCGKSSTKKDDGRCHICRIKKIVKDI